MRVKVGLVISLCITFVSFLILPWPQKAQTEHPPEHEINQRYSQRPGKDWTTEKTAYESIARHDFYQQELKSQGIETDGREATVTDTNDIAVVEDDGTVIIPASPFDLSTKSILFTPSANGYSITSSTGSFDSNLGTKLDLTQAPAMNPKLATTPGIDPGDDAYIQQDLGFNFSFYGTNYSNVAISSNGFLSFRPAGMDSATFDLNAVDSGESIAFLQSALPRIAAYWHDLDASTGSTQGTTGIYIRKEASRVLITWNNIRDFPNDPARDTGVHRFQVALFQDGRIQIYYDTAQLTSTALVGISAGPNSAATTPVDFSVTNGVQLSTPVAQIFSQSQGLDEVSAIKSFYAAHSGANDFDFVYVFLDTTVDLGNAFAYYSPFRVDMNGTGQDIIDPDKNGIILPTKFKGFLQMNNLNLEYPTFPTTRFLGANSALSIFGQEQGHYWLSYVSLPPALGTTMLGRADSHWSFFLNIESTNSHPAARRSSSMEGNVWRDNNNGTFSSVNLIDGYSRLDQYLMGLRPSSQVSELFVITNPTNTRNTRSSGPSPGAVVTGLKQTITIDQIVASNGLRTPDPATAQKKFRGAVILLEPKGQQASAASLNKITRYRLAWESYFAQSTDFIASINTGLAEPPVSRVIAVANGANYSNVVAPGAICSLFGQGLTNGQALLATPNQPLPTNLAGVEVRVDGVSASLFYAGPFQVNFQIPRATQATTQLSTTVQSATAFIEVYRDGQLIRAGAAQIAPNVPGVFSLSQDGVGAAAALDAITFQPAPFNAKQANGQPNFISLYTTGLGADVTDVDGDVSASVQVTLNGNPATVQYAGRAPGYFGLNQVNFQLPANITAGTYSVAMTRNGIQSNATTISIK